MTFESELRRELARCGIDVRRTRRIVAELRDHVACDPDADFGPPSLIAERFAEELRVADTRNATYAGFLALAVTAVCLFVAAGVGKVADPFGVRGVVASLAGLGVVVACQVAFVGGVLAVWRLLRGGAELRLVQRRMLVGLTAASVAVGGLAFQQVVLHAWNQPGWRLALGAMGIALPAAGLALAAILLRRASALTPAGLIGVAGVPRWFVLGTGALLCSAITIVTGFAEGNPVDGVFKGVFEALAFTGCFLALGRYLGLRRSIRHETVPTLHR